MSLKAIIPHGRAEITVNGLHQWDYGQKLEIHAEDLPSQVEVHFACAGMEDAVVRACDATTGVFQAAIPDKCLEQTTPIIAWVYETGQTHGQTIKTITLPIIPRTKPQPSETIPVEISDKYTEAVAAMNAAVRSVASGAVTIDYARRSGEANSADEADHANRATADAEGNDITITYAKKSELTAHTEEAELKLNAYAKKSELDTYAQKTELGRVWSMRTNQDLVDSNGNPIEQTIGVIPTGKALDNVTALAFAFRDANAETDLHFYGLRVNDVRLTENGSSYIEFLCLTEEYNPPVEGTAEQRTLSGVVKVKLQATYDDYMTLVFVSGWGRRTEFSYDATAKAFVQGASFLADLTDFGFKSSSRYTLRAVNVFFN